MLIQFFLNILSEIPPECQIVWIQIRPDKMSEYHVRVSNSLDSDQARQNVGPDLDPNCLQRLYVGNELKLDWHQSTK